MADSKGFHEAEDQLTSATRDMHRAVVSLIEELEATDWYQQRVDATADASLREILTHNRNEEMEHAAMLLEWIRRRSPTFEEHLRRYLFSEGTIAGEGEQPAGRGPGLPLPETIGSLRRNH